MYHDIVRRPNKSDEAARYCLTNERRGRGVDRLLCIKHDCSAATALHQNATDKLRNALHRTPRQAAAIVHTMDKLNERAQDTTVNLKARDSNRGTTTVLIYELTEKGSNPLHQSTI